MSSLKKIKTEKVKNQSPIKLFKFTLVILSETKKIKLMKTKHLIFFTMFISLSFIFVFTSCKSDNGDITDDTVLTTSTDEAQMSKMSDEITAETDIYISGLESTGYLVYSPSLVKEQGIIGLSTHPTVTVDKPDSTRFPKIVTIDFGTTGTVNQRGDTIKGKMVVTITGKMFVANSTRSIQFDNFSINGNSINGTKSVTYKGLNDVKNPYWIISAQLSFKFSDGKTKNWTSERTRERISVNNTPKVAWDDIFSIKGTTTGVNAKGNNYSIIIDNNNPLILVGGFPFFVKGSATTTVNSKVAVIDYGDGTKDNKATVTIDGVTKEITLRK